MDMREILRSIVLTVREMALHILSLFLTPGKCAFSAEEVKRILIIRMDGVGDTVLTLPAIQALRGRFPSAHITVLATGTNEGLFQGADYIDETVRYREGMDLKEMDFDLVFDFLDDYPLKTALIAYATKAKYRAGFDIKGRGVFFNLKIPKPDISRHYVDSMLDLAALVGAKAGEHSPELRMSSAEQEEAVRLLRENNIGAQDLVVCVHPGGKYWTNCWLPERFAALADVLIEERSAKILWVGAEYERGLVDGIKAKMKGASVSFCGQSLRATAALIQQSGLLVCNNSGLLHVACALSVPTVSTMGPAPSKKWWPVGPNNMVLRYELPCIECGKGYCRTGAHECMKRITVEDMLGAVKQQLEGLGKNR